jgi:hypothetical protein
MSFPITNEVDFRFEYGMVRFVRDPNDKNLWRVTITPGENIVFRPIRTPSIRITHEPSFPFAYRTYQAWLERCRNEELVEESFSLSSRFSLGAPSDRTPQPQFFAHCRLNRTQ